MVRHSLQHFFNHPRYRSLALSPDGSTFAYVCDADGRFDVFHQEIAGGARRRLTQLTDQDAGALAFLSDGLVFSTDRAGCELWQLWQLRDEAAAPRALTTRSDTQHLIHPRAAHPRGELLAFAAPGAAPGQMDVFLLDTKDFRSRTVASTGTYLLPGTWSPDGRYLLVAEVSAIDQIALLVLDSSTGALTRMTPAKHDAAYIPGPWFPDGRSFLVATDDGRKFSALMRMTLAGDRTILHETVGDIAGLGMDAAGRRIAIAAEEDGAQRLRVLDLPEHRLLDTGAVACGTLCDRWNDELFVREDGSILFYLSTSQHPKQPMLWRASGLPPEPLAPAMPAVVTEGELIVPDKVHLEADDGLPLQGWLYRPRGAGPFPCVLFLHGGPLAAVRPDYAPFTQYLLSRGIGFFAPNVRGSSGFGRSFARLVHRDWGGADVADARAAGRYMRSLPWVESNRCAMMGVSYGGFLALSCLWQEPQIWAAGIDLFGPVDLERLLRNAPANWAPALAESVGTDEQLRTRSPLHHVEKITAPLLVVQGANDPRVRLEQSEALVDKLRQWNTPCEYLLLPNEGHGMAERASSLTVFEAAARHLERYLFV